MYSGKMRIALDLRSFYTKQVVRGIKLYRWLEKAYYRCNGTDMELNKFLSEEMNDCHSLQLKMKYLSYQWFLQIYN